MPKRSIPAMILSMLVLSIGCSRHLHDPVEPESDSRSVNAMPDIVFLTRDGCVNTPIVKTNLDAAIDGLNLTIEYSIVDQGTLAAIDARVGYPTPTILINGHDIFDLPEPRPPFPAPM